MTARIYNAAEALALLDGTLAEGMIDGEPVGVVARRIADPDDGGVEETMSAGPDVVAALLCVRDDLAASVEHHAARADALAADLHRVTMELHAARHLAEEGQRARVKQSMELAKAQSRLSRMESALRDAVRRCQVDDCDRIATVCCLYGVVRIYACDACCDDVALTSQEPLPHADVLRSLDAPAGGDS